MCVVTVREFLSNFPSLKEISFITDGNAIETIKTDAPGSWKQLQKHHNEIVKRAFAMGESRIRIDSL
jgi:hypothetical protein